MNRLSQKTRLVFKSISKTIGWTAWNSGFGLGVLFSIFFVKLSLSHESSLYKMLNNKFISEKIIDEGIVLFLCCALMGEVSIDYILTKGMDFGKHISSLIVLVSVGSFFLVCFLFSHLFFYPKAGYDFDFLIRVQNYFMIGSGFYCVVFKTLLFYHHEK